MSQKKTAMVVVLFLAGSSAAPAQEELAEYFYQTYVWPCETVECIRVKLALLDAFFGSVDPEERTLDNIQEWMLQVQGITTEADLEAAVEEEMLRRQTFGYGGSSPQIPNPDIGGVGGVINGPGYQERLNELERTYTSSDYTWPPPAQSNPVPDYGGVGRIMQGDAYNESQDTGGTFYLPPSTYSAPPSFGGDAQTEAGFDYGTGTGGSGIYNAPAGGGYISVPSDIGSPIYNAP